MHASQCLNANLTISGNLDEFKKLFELTKTQTLFVDDSVKQIAKVVDELNDKDDVVVKAEAKTNRKKGKGPKTEVIMNQEKEQLTEPTLPEALRREIFTACRAGNAEELRNVYDINVAGGNEELQLGFLSYLNSSVTGENSPTLLHLAAFNSHRSLVRLLLELGADPTVKANSQQFKISQPMVPYQLCPERPLRQVFVEFRRANPDLWDWKAAQIPEPSDPHDDSKRYRTIMTEDLWVRPFLSFQTRETGGAPKKRS